MKRALNFLHLTTFYPPYSFGGDAMYIYRLAHALAEDGHHVDVIHDVDAYHLLHPREPEITFDEHPRVTRHALRSGFGWLSPLLSQQTGRPYLKIGKIKQVLKSRAYDVIQYHNISLLGPGILALEAPGGAAIKIYMTHEHWLVCPTHVLWKFNRQVCEKPDCLLCTLIAKRPPQFWRYTGMLDRMSRYVDYFVSPSLFTASMHAERGFPQPVGYLPYFIERVDLDWQQPSPPPQERPYFLFVGRLETIKGLHTLLDLWSDIGDFDLLVAGTGMQEQELRARAACIPQVKFLGALSQRDLGNLYYHALATIVPSLTYETFGIVILESFARKTPVVVRNLGALPEVVKESGGGYVYQDEVELLEILQRMVKAPETRMELGEKGYRAFLKNWCREAHLQRYYQLLDEVAMAKFGQIPWEI